MTSANTNYYIPYALSATLSEGTKNNPVYLDNYILKTCSKYAGGTAVTLNGTSKSASTASFYAPTTAGTVGQFLQFNNSTSKEPSWVTIQGIETNADTGTVAVSYVQGTTSTLHTYQNTTDTYFDIGLQSKHDGDRARFGLYHRSSDPVHKHRIFYRAAEETEDETAAIYTTQYAPSAADVGALPITGGTLTGDLTATSFSGIGTNLTALNASNITSGTIAVDRLPDATTSAKGVVKIGTGISVSSGTISVSGLAIAQASTPEEQYTLWIDTDEEAQAAMPLNGPKHKAFSITTSNWSGSGPYTYNLTMNGVTSSDAVIVLNLDASSQAHLKA